MAFKLFLDGFELPVAPPKMETTISNQNKTFTLANMMEVNALKFPGLTEVSFTVPVPRKNYPWKGNNASPQDVISKLEQLKTSMKPFQFIVSRDFDTGDRGFSTNMKASLEDYSLIEDAEDFSDLSISITLKQYRDYSAKVIYTSAEDTDKAETGNANSSSTSNPNNVANKKTYTVKHGDSLWEIAKKCLGDGSKYKELYSLNKALLDARNAKEGTSKYTIYTGQVLKLE